MTVRRGRDPSLTLRMTGRDEEKTTLPSSQSEATSPFRGGFVRVMQAQGEREKNRRAYGLGPWAGSFTDDQEGSGKGIVKITMHLAQKLNRKTDKTDKSLWKNSLDFRARKRIIRHA